MPSLISSSLQSFRKKCRELNLEPSEKVLLARLGEQKLYAIERGILQFILQFSFSAKFPCNEMDSHGTPTGLHQVAEKYGQNAGSGTVFVARKSTGERWMDRPDSGPHQPNLVVTRILRLTGLEPGFNQGGNVDSFNRMIYIHGTNHPHRFPENISAGCLLLRDADLIQLFDWTPLGSQIWIQ